MSNFKLYRLLSTFAGSVIAWYTTIGSFVNFYQVEKTIFKIKDCAIPNPITTPCFWGAVAFIVVAIWSYKLLKMNSEKSERNLLYFLSFATLFGWSSFYIENWTDLLKQGGVLAPCPINPTSPFLSACFYGSILFTLSFVISLFINKNSAD